MRRTFALASFLLACAGRAEATATLVTGPEEGVFSRAPAIETLVVESVAEDGAVREVSRARLPVGTLDLGDFLKTDVGALRVRGQDGAGASRVAGESLPFLFGAASGREVLVFVQRTGETARFPSSFQNPFPSDLVDVVASRYVLGVEGAKAELYDLASLAPVAGRLLPITPRSLAVDGTRALLVSDAAKATVLDFSTSERTELDAPAGGTFAEVAGGATIRTGDGVTYIVGATRKAVATSRVLRIAKDGALSFAELSAPRSGAGAAWIAGRGLVVAGGSAIAPGLEILAVGATRGTPLPFSPEPGTDLALAGLDGGRVVVVGQAPTFRVADLACAASCALTPLDVDGPAGLTLTFPRAVSFGASLLVTGTDSTSTSRAFLVAGTSVRELSLRVKRSRAALVPLPTGNVAIVGDAREIESFRP